ncbi:hypothetical protein Syun_019871 [Stephania yunnanensis]|uniref:Chaoptin n=1 Tax=Stephania yunnanensis TaxID=152371 RepID=A0AAP0IV03_9MAGN
MPNIFYTFLMFPNKGQALEYSSVQIPVLNAIDLSNNLFDGEIPTSIGDYKSLMSLNLSHNSLVDKIPSSLANLTQLESLDLSNNDLVGEIPSELTSLTFLSVLNVSQNHLIGMIPSGRQFDNFPISSGKILIRPYSWRGDRTFPVVEEQIEVHEHHQVLDLSYNSHLTGSLPEFPPGTALQQLFLAYTNYTGHIPHSIGNLKQLSKFTVGNCSFSGPLPDSFGNLGKLTLLELSRNNFEGEIPFSFSKLSHLKVLEMSSNRFVGPLPSIKASCKTIARIDLSSNKFSGPIPSFYANNGLPNLTYLDLSNNQLNGTIPPSLFTLPSLQEMYLDQNKFIGILDDEAFPNTISSPLTTLDLSYNLLEENIPKFISKFTSLEYLDLSSNNFHGAVDPRMFTSLKNLSVIHLSDNIMLLIDTSDLVITIPSLSEFAASSCNLSHVGFEDSFSNHSSSSLQILDLSSNNFEGSLPNFPSSLEILDLSSNHFEGSLPIFPSSLETLDLSSNNFEGSLPNFPEGMDFISLSKNKFTGAIPLTICNSSWRRIDLSHNQISGEIPSCLFNGIMDRYPISVVDLSKNKLQGMIPDTFGSECLLEGLNLNGNQLEGPLPRSLVNCRGLSVLDLGNNQIDDTFPFWLEHLESLQVLMLQSNKFHGLIRRRHVANSSFESLHIISLSANSFTGHLPLEYFPSLYLKGMYENDDHQTSHSAMPNIFYTFLMFPNKGQALEYSSVQIPVLNAIDLSSNLFDGEIPTSIGDYKSLMSLNLSHNSLVGKIPYSLANLRQLESLDLSNNDLVGRSLHN